jgi:two-component system, chemotaxis family, protein-glutamate methylesterase/glutaminase
MAQDNINKKCDLLVIGGSAGSLDAILSFLPGLKKNLSFPIVIVLHRKSTAESLLTDLFAAKTALKVKEAEEKELLKGATIYLAPADYHLLIENDHTISLDFSEKVQYSRPSIDVTFESASDVYGNSLVCLLLSGANADGTEGLRVVKRNGGLTLVQDPLTAEVSYMPQQAIDNKVADIVLTTTEITDYINNLSNQ